MTTTAQPSWPTAHRGTTAELSDPDPMHDPDRMARVWRDQPLIVDPDDAERMFDAWVLT